MIVKRISYLVVFSLLMSFFQMAKADDFSVSAQPSWVKSLPLTDKTTTKRDLQVRYLIREKQVNLTTPKPHRYSRYVVQPLAHGGLSEAALVQAHFNKDYQSLVFHHIDIIRDGRRLSKLDSARIEVSRRESDVENAVYSGEMVASAVISDLRVNDLLEIAYTVVGENPVFGDKYSSAFGLGWQRSVEQLAVRILTAAGKTLNYKVHGTLVEPEIKQAGANTEYTWKLQNVPAYTVLDDMPSWRVPFPWLEVSEFDSWVEVREWAEKLFTVDQKLTPDLEAKIVEWRKLPAEEQVEAALAFTQNEIRYVGLFFDENSHRPNSPLSILKNRYGDCKDKSVLLTTILKRLGVEVSPALVSFRKLKSVADSLPSPFAFDHVINTVTVGEATYWLDGTRQYQRGKLNRLGETNFGYALVIDSNDTALRKVESNLDVIPEISIVDYFSTPNFESSVELTITKRFTHSMAEYQRARFASQTDDQILAAENEIINFVYPFIESIGNVEHHDDADKNVFTTTAKYRIDDFFARENEKLTATFHAVHLAEFTRLPKTIRRDVPLAQYYPLKISHEIRMHFPIEVGTMEPAPAVNLSDPYMAYTYLGHNHNRHMVLNHELVLKSDEIPAAEVAKHVKLRQDISRQLSISQFFESHQFSEASYQSYLRVLDLLRERAGG